MIEVNVQTRYIRISRADDLPDGVSTISVGQLGLAAGDAGATRLSLGEDDNYFRIVAEHDGGGQSVRLINVKRQSGNPPSFASRNIENQTFTFLADTPIADNAEIVLPRARGGNGDLTYDLRGVRAIRRDSGNFTVSSLVA